MNQKQFLTLKKYENTLYTAVYANYIRALTVGQANELSIVGNDLGIMINNIHCPKCLLDFCKQLGIEYFKYKQDEAKTNTKTKTTKKKK